MKHTECKDCELSNGDCGYHFKMDGVTNYDIASLSACDKYGNCEFFKPKANLQGGLISRSEAEKLGATCLARRNENGQLEAIISLDNAPTVEIPIARWDCYCEGQKVGYEKALSERPQGEWVEAEITEEYRQYGFDLRVVCSRCGSEQSYFDFNEYHEPIAVTYIRSRFCSYCGAKMIKDFTGEAIP